MTKGLNTDLDHAGSTYHVQTEDWGRSNPYIVSTVYKSGQVVKVVKIPYSDFIPLDEEPQPQSIIHALSVQHKKVLALIAENKIK